MTLRRLAIVAMFASVPTAPVAAQRPAAGNGTLTLSDDERARLLDHNTEASVDAARAGQSSTVAPRRQIHGEVGAAIGSNGFRSQYGVAAIPLGDTAGAVVSFEHSQYGRGR